MNLFDKMKINLADKTGAKMKIYLIDNAGNSNLLDISKDVKVIIINQKVFSREGWWFGYDKKLYPKFVEVDAVTMGV